MTKFKTVDEIHAYMHKQDKLMQNALSNINQAYLQLNKLLEKQKKANEKAKADKPKSTAKKRPAKSGDAVPKKANQTTTRKKKV